MINPIAVLLKRQHRLEDILPYLEMIARPGMQVAFLIPHPMVGWAWWWDHCVTAETVTALIAVYRIMAHDRGHERLVPRERFNMTHSLYIKQTMTYARRYEL